MLLLLPSQFKSVEPNPLTLKTTKLLLESLRYKEIKI
jgi:hypothetical protein